MAMATLKVAHELHIDVPSELSVVGFANFSMSDYASPALTTIEQPFIEIGRTAVNMLLDMIREREEEQNHTAQAAASGAVMGNSHTFKATSTNQSNGNKSHSQHIQLLPTRLIERESVAAPAQK
jgi:DNA-binding LacI/PurR family transcriptional regulator